MPTKTTKRRAAADKRAGKSASTQAGEYVREKMHKLKRGKGSAKNKKQAIAIGLSEARKSGVKVPKKKGGARGGTKKKSSSSSGRKSTSKKK
jgi:hypothetical protein